MTFPVYWTKFATKKLDKIYKYYKTKVSKTIAQKLIDGIIDKSIKIENNPNIGQKEELLSNRKEEFRYIVYKNHKIIYYKNPIHKSIEIINVFDGRQNPNKIKKIKRI